MAQVTDTAPAVQSSVAMLVMTHHLTMKMSMKMMMMMSMTMTTSSGKTVVGKVGIGKFGKWKSCAIAFSHVVAEIRVPAQGQLGSPRGVLDESDDAQPLGEGPQPSYSRR